MKGHVSTPDELADHMVSHLFRREPPKNGDNIVYPGVGSRAPFVRAVERWCEKNDRPTPSGVGIELDSSRLDDVSDCVGDHVNLLERDFLAADLPSEIGEFEYVISNPPYVPIERLSEDEKEEYRSRFDTAIRRFDLYLLFFERSLTLLSKLGRLVFVTAEKYEYVKTAEPLRRMLADTYHVQKIKHLPEGTFEGNITYPTITAVDHLSSDQTKIHRRDGSEDTVELPEDGTSWASALRDTTGSLPDETGITLGDVCKRISPGIATGRDGIFVVGRGDCPSQLIENGWTYQTVSGRQLQNRGWDGSDVMICPYDEQGRLTSEDDLGTFGDWAKIHRSELEQRSCVENGTPWYGFHENPPLDDILQAKILCKDVAEEPEFWIDDEGDVLPRHTVYYLIPEDHVDVEELNQYLNATVVRNWLRANCQKAHNDFLRLQSSVLKNIPVPHKWSKTYQKH